MVHFVPLFEPSQDGDGVLDGRFIDHDGLEPAFESGILLDVLAVLVERRGTDAVEFASRQHGFQQVARVHGAFGLAGADDGVEFVDEEDDLTVRLLDFVQDGFQTFFELAAKLGARDQGAHVQREQGLVLEVVRHIALDDPLCEAFGDGRLTDAGLTDEARVVLGFPAQDPDDVSDLVVTADDRVQFLVAGHLGQVRAILLQDVIGLFRVIRRDLLVAADVLQDLHEFLVGDAARLQGLFQLAGGFVDDAEHEVLDGNVLVLHLCGDGLRLVHGGFQFLGAVDAVGRHAGDLRKGLYEVLYGVFQRGRTDTAAFDAAGNEAVLLLQEGQQDVLRQELLVAVGRRELLRALDGGNAFLCIFLEVHNCTSPCKYLL